MRARDIEKLPSLSQPTVHPDGDQVVVAVSFPHLRANANVGQLWAFDPHGDSAPQRITRGFRDSAPAFAPDGTALAFMRSSPGEPPQLYVVSVGQGEPMLLTDALLGIDSFRWTPDSGSLVFSTRVPEHGRYGTIAGLRADEESPRRQTTLRYRSNGLGYSNDRVGQLFLVMLPSSMAHRLCWIRRPSRIPNRQAMRPLAGFQKPPRSRPENLTTVPSHSLAMAPRCGL